VKKVLEIRTFHGPAHIVRRLPDVGELVDQVRHTRDVGVLRQEADDASPGVDHFSQGRPLAVRDRDVRGRVDVFRQARIGVRLGPHGGGDPVRVDEQEGDDLVGVVVEPSLDRGQVGGERAGVEEEAAAEADRVRQAQRTDRVLGRIADSRRMAEMQVVAVYVSLHLQHPDTIVELRRDRVILIRRHCHVEAVSSQRLGIVESRTKVRTVALGHAVRVVRADDRDVRVRAVAELGMSVTSALGGNRGDSDRAQKEVKVVSISAGSLSWGLTSDGRCSCAQSFVEGCASRSRSDDPPHGGDQAHSSSPQQAST
jgi:hypothetical protein